MGTILDASTSAVLKSLEEYQIPVVSPLAVDEEGQVYNCNADEAPAQLAISLEAERLVIMTDQPGVLPDVNNPKSVFSELNLPQVEVLKEHGIIVGGMIPKVDAAIRAANQGVTRVSLILGSERSALLREILSNGGTGTLIRGD